MKANSNWTDLGTCVSPAGCFVFGLHKPHFKVRNLRDDDVILRLGENEQGEPQLNLANFPPGDVEEPGADPIYEVANPFPFRGATYIGKRWADGNAADPGSIGIAPPPKVSLGKSLRKALDPSDETIGRIFATLPDPVKLALATTTTDPDDLERLARMSCRFTWDRDRVIPAGLAFTRDSRGRMRPEIFNHRLYDAVANNPHLPDPFKEAMVLRPGIQGESEIVGQWRKPGSHIFEYLRRNSYIPWGHYAANMAQDAIRYAAADLNDADMRGLRHLYYQRSYTRMAKELELEPPSGRKSITARHLENLRVDIMAAFNQGALPRFSATLWGWNYGFDYAPTGYRLHASHQQIHQQFALIPERVPAAIGEDAAEPKPAFACGDMIRSFVQQYRDRTGADFFQCYEKAIVSNQRMDGRKAGPRDLVVWADDRVMLFVPKAQTSQWELQLMPLAPVGNILEADARMRDSLDQGILMAMRALTALGATMITVFEYSKRFHHLDSTQRMIYVFLPRLPESPGAFSEAQLRWINGHYPEDFAQACRLKFNPDR